MRALDRGSEMDTALGLCEARGWATVFVPFSAGSAFPDGHYHIFYKRESRNGGGSIMVRDVQQVLDLLTGTVQAGTPMPRFGEAKERKESNASP